MFELNHDMTMISMRSSYVGLVRFLVCEWQSDNGFAVVEGTTALLHSYKFLAACGMVFYGVCPGSNAESAYVCTVLRALMSFQLQSISGVRKIRSSAGNIIMMIIFHSNMIMIFIIIIIIIIISRPPPKGQS